MRLFVLGFMVIALANCAPVAETPIEPSADAGPANTTVPDSANDSTRPNENLLDESSAEEDLDEEDLDIVVIGTFAGESGSAILKVSDGKQATYRLGDEVLSGIYLKNVGKNFVVLDVRGEAKQIPLSNQRQSQSSDETQGYNFNVHGYNFNAHSDYKHRLPFTVKADGRVIDRRGDVIGRVNYRGDIIDNSGKTIGRLSENQK